MSDYIPPIRDMSFVITELAGLDRVAALPPYHEATPDLVIAVLAEAGKLGAEVLAPLNAVGDREGCSLKGDAVTTPTGFAQAYAQFVEGGWNSLPFDPEHGGQGLPWLVSMAVSEIWHAANMAFALCPMLTQGAVESLSHHGSPEQQATYLQKLVSGEWTGTMNLTEPQAGSDLATVRTRAVRNGDHYLVSGQKIFITHGEHDMAGNIIHMVLARLPDAPPGVKGISLFIVPKFLAGADGGLGKRNDVRCVSLEHKLGIHGSPTAVMAFGDEGGAVGFLVGEENRGIEYMFTMMNNARLNVGLQGVAIADRAYQKARNYARERIQGRTPGGREPVSIIHHPDVRRMLMDMKAQVEAARALAYFTGAHLDLAKHLPDQTERAAAQSLVDLLTPVVKAWSTDIGISVANTAIQVHGGMGYIEETGVAQCLRDARIAAIYEGTNGIQAIDLVGRKVLRDGGAAARSFLDSVRRLDPQLAASPGDDMAVIRDKLRDAAGALAVATDWLLANAGRADAPLAAAAAYLDLFGTTAGGWLMARAALAAEARLRSGGEDADFLAAKIVTARHFAERFLTKSGSLLAALAAGPGTIMALDEDQF